MRRLQIILAMLVTTALAAGPVFAQQRNDIVVLQGKTGTQKVSGRVLAETWKSVLLDRDHDNRADVEYDAAQVRRVEYGNRPRYMVEAILLKRKPNELIAKLTRAYVDETTPKYVLQHAYYDIAAAYAELADKDADELPKAVQAYERLFRDIPDTKYAVTGRIELGNLLLGAGRTEEASRQFKALADGPFGEKVAREGKLMTARAELALKRFDRAEKLLAELATSAKAEDAESLQEVKLLRSRSLIGQKKYDEAYKNVETVLSEGPSNKVLGMAYCVLGDLFAERAADETALTAYLKVLVMYPETDAAEAGRARKQACLILDKLGRTEEAETLKRSVVE